MRYLIALTSSLLLLTASFGAPSPKEIEVLGNYVGHLEMTVAGSPSVRGDVRGEYTLGLQFVQQTWTLDAIPGVAPQLSGTTVMGYDAVQRVYRIARFVSDGSSGSGEGVWDEATRVLTWTLEDPGTGQTTLIKSTFSEDRAESWERTTTNREGKMISTSRGKNVRRDRDWPQEKPAGMLEKFGAFTVTDGASWYRFTKGGKFESGPMAMSGRTFEGKWTPGDNDMFTVIAKAGWMNGLQMIDDYRRIVFRISFLEKRPEMLGFSLGAPAELFDAYWYIDEPSKFRSRSNGDGVQQPGALANPENMWCR